MCRLVVAISKSGRAEELDEFINAMVSASAYDPYLEKVSKHGYRSHCHGWGYVVLNVDAIDSLATFYRSYRPIYLDPSGIEALKKILRRNRGTIVMVIHSRLAAREQPLGLENVHPIHIASERYELWVAHNGTVNKKEIARELSLQDLVDRYTDTFFLAKFLAARIEVGKSVVDAVREVIDRRWVETALNLGVVVKRLDCVEVLALNFYTSSDEKARNYYRMIVYRDSDAIVVASSTLELYINRMLAPMNNGDAVVARVSSSGVELSCINILR